MTDLRYFPDGTITPIHDITGLDGGDGDIFKAMAEAGWKRFLTLGDNYSTLEIRVWNRWKKGEITEYALEVESSDRCSEYVVVEGLPAMMALLAQWTPALTAGEISRVVDDLSSPAPRSHFGGIVEAVVTRAATQKRTPQ